MPISPTILRGASLLAAGCALSFSGCKERTIAVYTVPKEKLPEAKQEPGHEGHDHAPGEEHGDEPALPTVKWTLPAGWKDLGPESAGGPVKAVGRFAIEGSDATVNITPLGSFSGKEPMLVNMWRSVFGLDPLTDEESAKALTDIPVAGGQGKIFDLTGDQRGKKARIVTAMFNYGGQSWFFKLQGSPESVEPQVAPFKQFLATIKFEAATAAPTAPAPTPAAPATPVPAPEIPAPAGWTALAPGPMQIAKFTVPEKDGAKADVTVSVFPNDTGGTLSNVNRWRSQVGLPATDETGLKDCTAPLDGAPQGSLLADLKGESKSMIAAIVPKDGQYFFFKLTGDHAAVAAAKDSFVSFIRTGK
ncbi:MAG: hypothetical protein RL088_1195 [Verrucomicrobiota bacterium]|jgi:hypothetical protein